MSFTYTRAYLKSRMNAGIHGKQGMLTDADETVNEVVRECFGSGFMDETGKLWPLDFRSARRKTQLTPSLYNSVYDYAAPSDLSGEKIIDIPAQAKRQDGEFFLIPTAEFAVRPTKGAIAIKNYNGQQVLQICSDVNSKTFLIASLDALTSGGGTWGIYGDATSLAADTDDFIDGNGSLAFDLSAAGGTTAGIVNSTLSAIDLSDYFGGQSSIFVWARINSATNLTNYKLRFGSDGSNYYEQTVTAQHDGTAFVSGWNLLRFDISSLTTSGSPDNTAIDYIALFMTKTAGKISESDYKFDHLVVKRGVIHNVEYYTKYGWQNSSGTYLENSTNDTDVLVADADEFQVILQKAIEKANREVREFDVANEAERQFKAQAKAYMRRNPSEAKIMTTEYYTYG